MGRLSRRLGYNQPIDTGEYQDETIQPQSKDAVPNSPQEYADLEEYYRNLQQQRMQLQMQKRQQMQQMSETDYTSEHGDTKNPNIVAAEIESRPAPKGMMWMNIGGRPIDLHELEDYLVWKTSPFVMKTLMRYHNAKTMEDIKNYSRGRGTTVNARFFVMLLLCIGIAILGIVMIFFMPQILGFFKSGI